jgi:protein phosphatase
VFGDQLTIAHVGDSRAYTIKPDGRMEALTRDHSLVKRLEELGQLTAEEAAVHPQRNVLYRALGQGEPFDAEVTTSPLPKSGYLLICSDGLWGVISNDTIFNLISIAPSPAAACQFLVTAANTAGGPDNISAILIRLPE